MTERLSDATVMFGAPAEASALAEGAPASRAEAPLDDETLFYGDTASVLSSYAPSLRDVVGQLADASGMDAEARQAHLVEAAHAYHDARISSDEAASLHALVATHAITPPAPDVVRSWEIEALTAANKKFGDKAPERLAAAKAFVEARPALQQMLRDTGLGSHPRMVAALLENAHRHRAARTR